MVNYTTIFLACFLALAAAAPAVLESRSPDDEEAGPAPLYDVEEEPCRVGNLQYKHGEKVPRSDPCELCLCLHSGLFCWWQDQPGCPQRAAGPSGEAVSHSAVLPSSTAPDTPPCIRTQSCESGAVVASSPLPPMTQEVAELMSSAAPGSSSHMTSDPADSKQASATSPSAASASVASMSSVAPVSTSSPSHAATTCSVMGTEYQVGQILPRATGTCLECVCGEGARVSCSPKDCSSSGLHNDPSGTGSGGTGPGDLDLGPSMDMFDVDTF